MAAKRLLRAPDGSIYVIDSIASIHRVEIKGDRQSPTKVTAVHTTVCSVGGQTHPTSIPWEEASATFTAVHEPPADVPPQKEEPAA